MAAADTVGARRARPPGRHDGTRHATPGRAGMAALTVAALGVVFGDIGTSPLYALRECFRGEHGVAVTPLNVLGICSLVFWALVLVIAVKYLVFVMRADLRQRRPRQHHCAIQRL